MVLFAILVGTHYLFQGRAGRFEESRRAAPASRF